MIGLLIYYYSFFLVVYIVLWIAAEKQPKLEWYDLIPLGFATFIFRYFTSEE